MELLDTQWQTEHLASLGVIEVPRLQYLDLLAQAVRSQ
jgi:leucyl/phenylalanyl-tRNA--protein transferase